MINGITTDQVRDVIERHSAWVIGNNRCFHNGAYEAIADELNKVLGGDECMTEYVTVWKDNEPTKLHWGVPVVRCRDCTHMHTVRNWLGKDMDECWLHADRESGALGKVRTEPDGFCAWGKLKGDAE